MSTAEFYTGVHFDPLLVDAERAGFETVCGGPIDKLSTTFKPDKVTCPACRAGLGLEKLTTQAVPGI